MFGSFVLFAVLRLVSLWARLGGLRDFLGNFIAGGDSGLAVFAPDWGLCARLGGLRNCCLNSVLYFNNL